MVYDIGMIRDLAEKYYAEIVGIRRQLHENPELSEHEVETENLICNYLAKNNISYKNGVAGHGVIAQIEGKNPQRAVGIRADIDALPICEKVNLPFASKNLGVMHGCGHDIHTAVLMGTARILNDVRDCLPCSVKLFFQPSEETVGGALPMIEEGCLKNPEVESVIGLHVDPFFKYDSVQIKRGEANAASCEFYVKVEGESCHGASPYEGSDPILPACEMVVSLQSVLRGAVSAVEGDLITVGKIHSGTKNNVVPAVAEFSGIIRTLKNEHRSLIKERINRLCTGIAAAHGTKCEIVFEDSYPALVNDIDIYNTMIEACGEVLGKDKVLEVSEASMGADDFSYFCKYTKGLYYNIGSSPTHEHASPVHSDTFCPDERCILTGMLTEVWGTLKIMEKMK